MKIKSILNEAAENHELLEALLDAYKWSNTFSEKVLRLEEIRIGICETFHYSLEEEEQELKSVLKKASGKILYLHYLSGNALLEKNYSKDFKSLTEMVTTFERAVRVVVDYMLMAN